jgi:hypothetical protein
MNPRPKVASPTTDPLLYPDQEVLNAGSQPWTLNPGPWVLDPKPLGLFMFPLLSQALRIAPNPDQFQVPARITPSLLWQDLKSTHASLSVLLSETDALPAPSSSLDQLSAYFDLASRAEDEAKLANPSRKALAVIGLACQVDPKLSIQKSKNPKAQDYRA